VCSSDQQEQLYKITGLDQASATNLLLERLDRELKNETGALILEHQNRVFRLRRRPSSG
jgi:ribonuclease Y